MQVTLDKIKNPFKLLKDTKAETEIVINSLVTGIKTLLNIIFIASQNNRESDQENPSGHEDSVIPLLNKGKAKDSMP